MKSVFLDCAVINPGDVSWEPLQRVGELEYYRSTEPEDVAVRLQGVEAVFTDISAMKLN